MIFPCPRSCPENLVSRDRFGSPVPRQPAHLHTRAEFGAYLRDSSRVPRRRPFIYLNHHTPSGGLPNVVGHAIAYRWRLLPRVRRHRASSSSKRVLPWQITMDQLICAFLSHAHYWYEVGTFKVPAVAPYQYSQLFPLQPSSFVRYQAQQRSQCYCRPSTYMLQPQRCRRLCRLAD